MLAVHTSGLKWKSSVDVIGKTLCTRMAQIYDKILKCATLLLRNVGYFRIFNL